MSGPKWSARELGQADVSPSVPQPRGAAAQLMSHICFSLQEESLEHSLCCPIPWILHDNKVERVGRAARGAWSREGLLLPLLLASATHSSPTLSCRAPQHGRINAENEPSPRHGAHGARPTGNLLSVHPSPWPSVCPCLLSSFHSLSVFPHCLACKGLRRGCDQVPSCALCPELGWPHTQPGAAPSAAELRTSAGSWGRGASGSPLVDRPFQRERCANLW